MKNVLFSLLQSRFKQPESRPWHYSAWVTVALGLWMASGAAVVANPTSPTALPQALETTSLDTASPGIEEGASQALPSFQAQDLQQVDSVVQVSADPTLLPDLGVQLQADSSTINPANSAVAQNPETGDAESATTDQADLARQSQNPIANLISVPFQNNTNFGVGAFDQTSNVLNIQPVIPTALSEDWVLINRTIIPIAYQPELAPGLNSAFGLGDILYQGFLSPKNSGSFTWGVGPAIALPTATDEVLGTGKWSIGPAAVGLVTRGPIVAGALVNNIWSIAGDGDRANVSLLTLQPFFNYNFDQGWYVTTSPIINANWLAAEEKWTVPIGGGFGRVFAINRQPVNMSLQGYWNAIRPESAADWTLRAQVTFLFP